VVASVLSRLRHSVKPRWFVAAVRCLLPLRHGVTVVSVNWNSVEMLHQHVRAVRRFAPEARILVVDNGSDDGSREALGQLPVRAILLDRNLGHGAALDIGCLAARTRYVVTLDIDAFPISESWLPTLLALLDGAHVAGIESGARVQEQVGVTDEDPEWRDRPPFVHPANAVIRLRRFVYRRHSWRKHPTERRVLDPGERLSAAEAGHLGFLPLTEVTGPGHVGQIYGDVVYHNCYGTRHRRVP
jgi:glycosyltransferase involved in cell wall biosynthesis